MNVKIIRLFMSLRNNFIVETIILLNINISLVQLIPIFKKKLLHCQFLLKKVHCSFIFIHLNLFHYYFFLKIYLITCIVIYVMLQLCLNHKFVMTEKRQFISLPQP